MTMVMFSIIVDIIEMVNRSTGWGLGVAYVTLAVFGTAQFCDEEK